MERILQFDIWIADLNPRIGTEPGKRRPVLIVQSKLMNDILHPSTLICPITTQIKDGFTILRQRLNQDEANMNADCEVMIDQVRAIDNSRLIKKVGVLPKKYIESVKQGLKIMMDLED